MKLLPFGDFMINEMIVNIFYENKEPKFDGNKLGYLLKITVSHNDLNLLKEFVEKSTNSNNSFGTINIYNSRHHGYWDSSNRNYRKGSVILQIKFKVSFISFKPILNKNSFD